MTLAGFCGCAGRFVSGLVRNSRRHLLSCRGSYIILKEKKEDLYKAHMFMMIVMFYSTGQGFFHQSARPRVQRGPMERIKILHPATVTPESASTLRHWQVKKWTIRAKQQYLLRDIPRVSAGGEKGRDKSGRGLQLMYYNLHIFFFQVI